MDVVRQNTVNPTGRARNATLSTNFAAFLQSRTTMLDGKAISSTRAAKIPAALAPLVASPPHDHSLAAEWGRNARRLHELSAYGSEGSVIPDGSDGSVITEGRVVGR